MLNHFFDSILSKLGELIADRAYDNVISVSTLKTLQKSSKSLSAKAFDVEEVIKNAEQSGQKKRKREIEEWLIDVKSIGIEVLEFVHEVEAAGFIRKLFIGGKVSRLNEEVEKLVEQSQHFGGELVVDARGSRGETLPTTSMVGAIFEENLKRICGLLEAGQVSRIGVHGMGGAGKTTLAMHLNNQILEHCDGRVFWVTVSHEFAIKSLQDKIAHSLGVKHLLDEDDEVIIRAAKLRRALSEMKNSVLILDDVWEYVDLLKLGCPVSKECCRLVITTRSLEVCDQIGCEEKVAVQKLDEEEAWKLFSETLGEEIKLAPQVEEIAKSMAKLCGGLPLGIVTLAGSMRGETAIHTWRNAVGVLKESMAGQDGMREVEVFKVLKYSFDRLNKHDESESNEELNMFQLCFLYCSLYPEDLEIPRKELVSKLISEGLLERRKRRREQVDQGRIILDKLVRVCLLESSIDKKFVKMHDLVRGMALQIGGGKYMVRAGDRSLKEIPKDEEWTEDLEKVSLMRSDIRSIPHETSPNCPNLSTLFLHYCPYLEFIPDSFFTKMKGLCTLDLSGIRIKMLPNSVSELESLKALLLRQCSKLEKVPNLGKLKGLRELNLDHTAIKEVPQGVEELLNLKFLSLDAWKLEILPRGLLLNLRCLQCVRLPNHLQVAIEEVENLKELEAFRGRVKNVCDFISFIKSRVHDTSYTIQVGSVSEEEDDEEEEEEEDCLGNFNKKVAILTEYCRLNDEKVLGQDIECLTISQCEGLSNCFLDEFSPSNCPTSLKKLKIKRCGGIECIVRSEQELASQNSCLEDLQLEELKDFEGVQMIGKGGMELGGVFSSLRRLHVHKCNKMMKMGLPVWGFPNLQCIHISWCLEMEEIFEDEGRVASLTHPRLRQVSLSNLPRLKSVCKATILAFPNLEEIRIMDCSEIEEIFEDEGRADSLTLALSKLKMLSLYNLPRLKSICKTTIICNSIQIIRICSCPRLLKKLPLHFDVLPSPTLIVIAVSREWWESLEWDNPNLPTLLQPFLRFR